MPEPFPSLVGLSPAHQRRLTWALREVGEALKTALARDESARAVCLRGKAGEDQVYALGQMIMEQADPTANKRFTPWLVREYAAGRLILEDLGPANETLSLFQRYASRLKPEQRDIQRYKNLAAAWEAVREFAERDEAHSNRAQKALDRAQAYAESRILRQDPDGFTVAVPLTEFAAKWWGRGTRWCTSAEKGNRFSEYHRTAPLIVVLISTKKGIKKLQMWVTAQDVQFMDERDVPVSKKTITKYWSLLEPVMRQTVRICGEFIARIPFEKRTLAISLAAAENDVRAAKHIPIGWIRREMCERLVKTNAQGLSYVPVAIQDASLYDLAVKHHWDALAHIKPWNISPKMMRLAVEQNWRALRWLPRYETVARSAFSDHQEWFAVIEHTVEKHPPAIEFIPSVWRTPGIIEKAISRDGLTIRHLRKAESNAALRRLAVHQNPKALALLDHDDRTKELCAAALPHDGKLLPCVPSRVLDAELCDIAIKQTGLALQYVPMTLRTTTLCEKAISQNGLALEWVPPEQRTAERCLIAVSRDGRALAFVPHPQRTLTLCELAIKNDGRAIGEVPHELVTQDLCELAIHHSKGVHNGPLKMVPYEFRTPELCREAVTKNPWDILNTPENFRTIDLCRIAVTQDRCLLDLMPKKIYPVLRQEVVRSDEKSAISKTPYWGAELLDVWEEALRRPRSVERVLNHTQPSN